MRLSEALRDVIAANERVVLRRLIVQGLLLILSVVGVARFDTPWRWLWLVLALLLTAGVAQLVFFFAYWSRKPIDQPWRALALGARRRREQVLELHAFGGEVLHLPVPLALLPQVLEAAREEQVELATDEESHARLVGTSARAAQLRDLVELLPSIDPDLRALVNQTLEKVPAFGGVAGVDGALRSLEVHLRAERSVQTTTSLRGPRTVFAAEIRTDLAALTRLLG